MGKMIDVVHNWFAPGMVRRDSADIWLEIHAPFSRDQSRDKENEVLSDCSEHSDSSVWPFLTRGWPV